MRRKVEKTIILMEARFDYTQKSLDYFVKLYNEGVSFSNIANKMFITLTDVYLLVLHCANEDLIEPREGNIWGKEKPKKRGRPKKGSVIAWIESEKEGK